MARLWATFADPKRFGAMLRDRFRASLEGLQPMPRYKTASSCTRRRISKPSAIIIIRPLQPEQGMAQQSHSSHVAQDNLCDMTSAADVLPAFLHLEPQACHRGGAKPASTITPDA